MRVIQYGVGAMGSLMVQLLATKPGVELIGGIDHDAAKLGRDLGSVAGLGRKLEAFVDGADGLAMMKGDVALHATTAFADEAFPIIAALIARGMNVVTITQELFFPLGRNIAIAAEIDRLAKAAGVAVTAIGVNPGFILDVLPVAASLPCWSVDRISGRRVVDFSPYGPDEMVHIGAGLSEDDFVHGASRGEIGHIGLLESAAMLVHALGLQVDELVQVKEPLVTGRTRQTEFVRIERGAVAGFRQTVTGSHKGRETIALEMIGLLDPGSDDPAMGDHFRIEGTPSVDVTTREQISQRGGLGTAAAAVNTIPRLLAAAPGFHTAYQLSIPHIWAGKRMAAADITTRTIVERASVAA